MRDPVRDRARGKVLLAAATLALVECGGGAHAAGRPASNPIGEAFALIFDSECIRLAVVGDSLEVRGRYVLLCRTPTDHPIALFHPFPRDSLLGGARMVSLLMRAGPGVPAPARWEDLPGASGVRWWVPPCPGDSIVAESVYRQKLDAAYAHYVVTSTRVWGRPLRRARFEIRLPAGAVPIDFSFAFERLPGGCATCYVYEAEDFFPDRDIVVRWRP